MADVNEQRVAIQDARDKNEQASARFTGVADDTKAALDRLSDIPDILAATIDVLDTQLGNASAARALAEEAQTSVKVADENLDYTEASNAFELLEHMTETADGISGVLTEAKEALNLAMARLDEVKLSLEAGHNASDEALLSAGSAEENLSQLAERLG